MSKSFDVKNLNLNDAGNWPPAVKGVAAALVIVVVLALAWFASISADSDTLESLRGQEAQLKQDFEAKQRRAANLEPLKQQLAQMEVMLQQLLRQLPSRTEMPDLIVDISQTALASGISNELFQPGPEVARDLYAEKPIALRMVGSYHQFGAFVSGVASLPRVVIMTMHDISLKPLERSGAAANTLLLSGTIKTYRYLDEEEVEEAARAAEAAKKQGGR